MCMIFGLSFYKVLQINQKIIIDAKFCAPDKAVFWESFKKGKHVNKF